MAIFILVLVKVARKPLYLKPLTASIFLGIECNFFLCHFSILVCTVFFSYFAICSELFSFVTYNRSVVEGHISIELMPNNEINVFTKVRFKNYVKQMR